MRPLRLLLLPTATRRALLITPPTRLTRAGCPRALPACGDESKDGSGPKSNRTIMRKVMLIIPTKLVMETGQAPGTQTQQTPRRRARQAAKPQPAQENGLPVTHVAVRIVIALNVGNAASAEVRVAVAAAVVAAARGVAMAAGTPSVDAMMHGKRATRTGATITVVTKVDAPRQAPTRAPTHRVPMGRAPRRHARTWRVTPRRSPMAMSRMAI